MRRLIIILLLLPLFADSQIINASPYYRPAVVESGSCADTDAQAYLTASGITDPTTQTAICTLVKQLKDSSVWTYLYAIYPMAGGTSSTCKWNLKDPRDLDAAFRLTFIGGITFSSTGALPDGSSGWADTHFTPATDWATDDAHMSFYSRTNTAKGYDMGAYDGPDNMLASRYTGTNTFYGGFGVVYTTASNTDSRGYFLVNRISSTNNNTFKNGVEVANAAGFWSPASLSIAIFADHRTSTIEFTDHECAFATIGPTLTNDQARALNNIVEAFNVTLSRGVE